MMEQGQAEKFVFDLLRLMLAKSASDLFITVGFPPALKVNGKLMPVSSKVLTILQAREISRAIMNDKQTLEFDASKECNFAIGIPNEARFRVNAFV
jgi:twitching motility protein PilU